MSTLDVLVLLLIMTGCWHGNRRGFADQVAALVTLVVGFGTACSVSRLAPFASILERVTGLETVPATVLAWATIYFSVCLGLTLIVRSYHETLEDRELAWLDSGMGGLLGALKVFTVCTALTLVAAGVSDRARAAILTTHSGQAMAHALSAVDDALPPQLAERLAPMLSGLEPPLPAADVSDQAAPAPESSKPPALPERAPSAKATTPKAPRPHAAPPHAVPAANSPIRTREKNRLSWPPARLPTSGQATDPGNSSH